jgi:hypothetical protein
VELQPHSSTRLHIFLLSPCTHLSLPITVATRSKVLTVFARSNAGIMGSNPTQDMDVCVCVYSVIVLFCVSSGLATG